MRRPFPPSHPKVAPGPQALPQPPSQGCPVGESPAVVNHYSAADKSVPAIPSWPGIRTSATFLSSLGANLRIEPDLPSPSLTPTAPHPANFPLCPLPPTPLASPTRSAPPSPDSAVPNSKTTSSVGKTAPVARAENELPQLLTYTTESEEERTLGLDLVADSVAQQRQVCNKVVMFHPVSLVAFLIIQAVSAQYTWIWYHEITMLLTTFGGITFSFMLFARWMTDPYVCHAGEIDRMWLGQDGQIVAKWGEEIIGALVLAWAGDDAAKKRGRRRRGKAVIRAWTVKLKYRGKGIGESLLEEAVKLAGERGANGIVFDGDHANSRRVLPALFNGFLDKQEARAEQALRKIADEKGNFRQRQGSPTWGSR